MLINSREARAVCERVKTYLSHVDGIDGIMQRHIEAEWGERGLRAVISASVLDKVLCDVIQTVSEAATDG